MQFIEDKGSRGKRILQRIRWLIPAALLVGGLFIVIMMHHTTPAFAQPLQRVDHAAILNERYLDKMTLPQCWDERNECQDSATQKSEDDDSSSSDLCDPSDDVFRSYAAGEKSVFHTECVTPMPVETTPAEPQATPPPHRPQPGTTVHTPRPDPVVHVPVPALPLTGSDPAPAQASRFR